VRAARLGSGSLFASGGGGLSADSRRQAVCRSLRRWIVGLTGSGVGAQQAPAAAPAADAAVLGDAEPSSEDAPAKRGLPDRHCVE